MSQPRVEVVLADGYVPDGLRQALQEVHASFTFWPLAEARHRDPSSADALVLVLPGDLNPNLEAVQHLLRRLAEHPRAILAVGLAGAPPPMLGQAPTIPVLVAHDADAANLAVKLNLLLELSGTLEALYRDRLARSRSGMHVARRFANQLRLASRVQREFLPESLPRFGQVSFEVLFRPLDYVSGDIYDVRRLDDEHVGIALADASGHGIPAALLTVYLKRALRGKELTNGAYRILPPDEVLRRLNEDLLEAHLGECPFVAAFYAVLNVTTRVFSFARAGAPYPLLRSHNGELRTLVTRGSVVGVSAGAPFEGREVELQPGDTVLIHSDGLERIATAAWGGTREGTPQTSTDWPAETEAKACQSPSPPAVTGGGPASATAVEELPVVTMSVRTGAPLLSPAFCDTLRVRGAHAAMEQLSHRQRTLRRLGFPLDDLTVLAVHVKNQSAH